MRSIANPIMATLTCIFLATIPLIALLRANVAPGTSVEVVQKQHQRTGELTPGAVGRLLTSAGYHPRGIKVRILVLAQYIAGFCFQLSCEGATSFSKDPYLTRS